VGEPLRYGVVVAPAGATVDTVAERLGRIEALGFDHAWMPGIPNGPDILTLLAVAGRAATHRIEIGSAVVPAFPRHPAALATQALVVGDALGGRFTLGLGLSHRKVVEDHLGLSYERPAAYMRDYLAILRPLLADQAADHTGERLRTRLWLDVATTAPAAPPVMLAALGPQMLTLAGRVADGVMTWMTGPATLEHHIVPAVVAAAADAGRPPPRVLVSLPILLTNDRAAGLDRANDEFALYGRLPAYQAVLARERTALTAPGPPANAGHHPGHADDRSTGRSDGTPGDGSSAASHGGRGAAVGDDDWRRRSAKSLGGVGLAGGSSGRGQGGDGEARPLAPGDVALVGDEGELGRALGRLRDVGVTDFQATPFGDQDDIDRTIGFLATRPGG
jgi:F420-dependent oxidoreductase-like protein